MGGRRDEVLVSSRRMRRVPLPRRAVAGAQLHRDRGAVAPVVLTRLRAERRGRRRPLGLGSRLTGMLHPAVLALARGEGVQLHQHAALCSSVATRGAPSAGLRPCRRAGRAPWRCAAKRARGRASTARRPSMSTCTPPPSTSRTIAPEGREAEEAVAVVLVVEQEEEVVVMEEVAMLEEEVAMLEELP